MSELKEMINKINKWDLWKCKTIKGFIEQKMELLEKEEEWKKIVEYNNRPNYLKEFVDEMIIDLTENGTKESDYQIGIKEIYYEYVVWYKSIHNEESRFLMKDLKIYLNERFPKRNPFKNSKNAWLGLKLRDFEEVQALKLLNEESTS